MPARWSSSSCASSYDPLQHRRAQHQLEGMRPRRSRPHSGVSGCRAVGLGQQAVGGPADEHGEHHRAADHDHGAEQVLHAFEP